MSKTIGSVPYSLALRPCNPTDKHSEKKIYGSIQQRETIGLRQLATHIREHGSSFSVGTLQGVLADMVECTRELLKQGYSVNYEGLMRLYITASSEGVDSVEDFVPSIHLKRINLRGDVDDEVKTYLNSEVDYEYVMTREEQAKAKKAAKEALVQEGGDDGDDGGDNGGGDITGGDDQTE